MPLVACIASSEHDITSHKERITEQRLSVLSAHVAHRFAAKRGRIYLSVPSSYATYHEDVIINAGCIFLAMRVNRSTLRARHPPMHLPVQSGALSARSSRARAGANDAALSCGSKCRRQAARSSLTARFQARLQLPEHLTASALPSWPVTASAARISASRSRNGARTRRGKEGGEQQRQTLAQFPWRPAKA
jgi:hypothetical protein